MIERQPTRALVSIGPLLTIGATAVAVLWLHVDHGDCLSLLLIALATLTAPVLSPLLILLGLSMRRRRRDLRWPANARIAIGVGCGALLVAVMLTNVEWWVFHCWHARSLERVIAGELETVPGGSVVRFENELVFTYPGCFSKVFIYDHGGATVNPDGPTSGAGSIWESSWYSRDRAIHLGGKWYCDLGPWN